MALTLNTAGLDFLSQIPSGKRRNWERQAREHLHRGGVVSGGNKGRPPSPLLSPRTHATPPPTTTILVNNDPNHPVDLEIAEGDGESDSVEDARTGSDLGSRPSKRGVQLRRAKQQGRHPSPVGDIQPEGGDVPPPPVSGTVGDQDPQIPSAASSRAERAGRHWARQQRAQQRKQITTSSSSPDTSGVKEGGSRWERQTRQHTILWRGEYTFIGEEDPKNFDGVQFSLEIPSIT